MKDNDKKPFNIKPLIPPLIAFALEAGSIGVGFAGLHAPFILSSILLLMAIIMPVAGIIICSASIKSENSTNLSCVLCLIFILIPIPIIIIVSLWLGFVVMILVGM